MVAVGRFCFRLHVCSGKRLLAVADSDLLGKTVKFGEVDFYVSKSFYGEDEAGPEKILEEIKGAGIVNVVGRRIVRLLVEKKMVSEDCILWMGKTPHVQILRI